MENVRKRDIRRHDKREAMYYHKAGSLCILRIMKLCLWEEKLSLLLQGIFKFCQNGKIFASAGQSTFLQ